MFETFNVPGLYISIHPNLVLYSEGKFTGFVLELGDGFSQFAPIYDGYIPDPYSHILTNFGGRDLTEYMVKLLRETGNRFSTDAQREIVRHIKEKCCYVAYDFDKEYKSIEPFDYELPDETHIVTKEQRIRCPEALFKPSMIGNEGNSISETCFNSITKCDIDIRKDLYNCIIVSGGNSMFNGLPERLTKEIKYLAPESMKEEVKVIASPERKYDVWKGGSFLSSIETFDSQWITRTEYEESGAYIVHQKCNQWIFKQ